MKAEGLLQLSRKLVASQIRERILRTALLETLKDIPCQHQIDEALRLTMNDNLLVNLFTEQVRRGFAMDVLDLFVENEETAFKDPDVKAQIEGGITDLLNQA